MAIPREKRDEQFPATDLSVLFVYRYNSRRVPTRELECMLIFIACV